MTEKNKKMTNAERDKVLVKFAQKAANSELVLSLFIEFMGKKVDFKKFLIDWEEKQKELKEKNDNGIIMPQEKKIITP